MGVEFAAQVLAFAAELEQTRLVAAPAALEADLAQVVPVIEARGEQEQRMEIGGIIELFPPDQGHQRHVAFSAEVPGKHLQHVADRWDSLGGRCVAQGFG